MEATTHELICKLHSALSALEKKRMAELFGAGYPTEDLNGDACLRVVAKFRKSARGKLKAQSLLRHFHAHFTISEKDQIDILDETISENECAMRFLDIVNIKASFPIGALYLALLESSNEQYGPPTHHQLACELKRIVQEESSHISLTMVDSTKSADIMAESQALLDIIEKLRGIMVTPEQAQSLSEKWGISKIMDTTELSEICYQWKTKRGVWCTKYDLIEGLVLTRGVGCHLVKLKTAVSPQLKPFLQGLQYQWTTVAEYIGFKEFEIKTITEANEEISEQLDHFLYLWNIPDCGDKTIVILQRLKVAAGIQDIVVKPAANKIGMSSQLSLDPSIVPVMSSPKTLDPPSASLPASLPSGSPSTGFRKIQPSKGYPSRLRLTIIQPKLLSESYESSFDQQMHSIDGSRLPPPSITEILPSTSVSDKEDHSEMFSNDFNDLSSTAPPSKIKNVYRQQNPVDSNSSSLPIVTSINSLPSKSSLLASQTTVESQSTNILAIQAPLIDGNQTDSQNDTKKVQLPQVKSESEWPSPIQQSQMTVPSALPLPSYQANLHFTAPIATTNLTWSANPPTSHALVMSRSSLYEVPNVESDSSYPHSLPPPFTSPITSRPQVTDAMVVCPSSSSLMSQKENLSAVVNSDHMKGSIVTVQSGHGEEYATIEDPKSVSSMSESEVTKCKQNDTKPTDTPLVHHSDVVDLVQSLLHTNAIETFETVLKSLQNAVYEINKPVPFEFSQSGEAPLHLAVAKGYVEKIALLITYGANVNQVEKSKGYSPLHIACETGNVEVVNLLINNGANVNQNDESLNTPLIVASLNVNPRCVSILINSGADIEASNKDGHTALDVAVVVNSVDIVQLLLNSDLPANVHHIRTCVSDGNEYKVTPIADAGARGHLEIFKILEEKGADINTTGPKNKIPDIKSGDISPLLLACMKNQVEIVRYITSRENFDSRLPCIADPVIEALKGGHFECAKIIWKRYGGFQLMLENSTEFHELNDCLKALKNDYDNKEDEPYATKGELKLNQEQEHEPSSKRDNILLTDADSDIDEMTAQEVNDLSTCEEPPVSEGEHGETQLNISSTSLGSQSHGTTAQSFVLENDLMNNLSDVDTVSSQSQAKAASVATSSQLASYTVNDINPLDSKQEGGSATDATTDDDPFTPRPKSPIPFTHTDLLPPSDTEMSIAQAVDQSGNLRSFQTSAIEVLHHFAQYLILACLQRHSEEDIISRAEGIGEPSLVHFFSRYFHDSAGAARGSEFVAEFIRGFPSPLNFLLSAQLCKKEEFEGVLRDFGNTEFPEQLMLALHQFPDSDNIPWSGTELLNALFRQTFSVGTPFPVPAMQMRTRQEHSRESRPSTSAVQPSFPGDGHVLGRREGPPLTNPSASKKLPVHITTNSPHPQDSLSQATKTVETGIDSASGGMNNLDAVDEASYSPQISSEPQESVSVGFSSVPNETGNLGNVPGQQQSEQQSLAVTSVLTSYGSSSMTLGVSSVSSVHALSSSSLMMPPLPSSSTMSVITSQSPYLPLSMPISSSPSLPFSTTLPYLITVPVTSSSVAGFSSTSILSTISHLPLTAPVVTPTVIPSVPIVSSVPFSPNVCAGSSLYQYHYTTSVMQSRTVSTFSPITSVTNPKPTSSTETSIQTRIKAILFSSDSEAEEHIVKEHSESTSGSDHRGYDYTQGSPPGVLKSTAITTKKMEVHAQQSPQSVAELHTDHELSEKTRVKSGIPKEQNEVDPVSKSSVVMTSKASPKVSRSKQAMSSEFSMKGNFVRTVFASKIPRSQHTSLKDPLLKQKFPALPGASPSPPMRSKAKQSLKQAVNTKEKTDVKLSTKRKQVVPTKDRDGRLELGPPFLKHESEVTETHTDLGHVTKVGQVNAHLAFAMVYELKTILPNMRIDNAESLFVTLSPKLSNWKMLGRYLLLSDENIEVISRIDSDQDKQAYHMLKLWSSHNDKNATFLSLGEALCSCMQYQLVEELKRFSEGNNVLTVIENSKEKSKFVNDSDCDTTSEVSEASLVKQEETSASNVINSEVASDFTVTGTVDTVLTILECTLKSQAKGSKVTVYVKYD